MTELSIPELSLVVLVGVTGSGKSTFARAHFKPTEVISSDFCRGLVADDENDQSATPAAFELLHYIAGQRLAGALAGGRRLSGVSRGLSRQPHRAQKWSGSGGKSSN